MVGLCYYNQSVELLGLYPIQREPPEDHEGSHADDTVRQTQDSRPSGLRHGTLLWSQRLPGLEAPHSI